jgi:hypothetical protein
MTTRPETQVTRHDGALDDICETHLLDSEPWTPRTRNASFATRCVSVIDPMLFGVDSEETNPDTRATQLRDAALLSGVMWHASITLVDKAFEDVVLVHAQPHSQWAEIVDDTDVLSRLPARFWHQVTPGFANRFAATIVDLTGRVSRGWTPLACVAHELALTCLLDEMEVIADTYEVPLPSEWRTDLEESFLEDLDHEFLYAPEYDGFEHDPDFGPPGMAPMHFNDWFKPFNQDRRLPPFLEDHG